MNGYCDNDRERKIVTFVVGDILVYIESSDVLLLYGCMFYTSGWVDHVVDIYLHILYSVSPVQSRWEGNIM